MTLFPEAQLVLALDARSVTPAHAKVVSL